MPKSEKGSWFEQHVEKVVLGVSLLLLIFVLLYWVWGSPRKLLLSVPREQAGRIEDQWPGRAKQVEEGSALRVPVELADPVLARWADEIVKKHDRAQPNPWEPPNSGQELEIRQARPFVRFLPPLGPTVPPDPTLLTRLPPELARQVGGMREGPTLADILPAIPKVPAPKVWAGAKLPYPDPGREPADVTGAHVAAVIDLGPTLQAWHDKLRWRSIPTRLAFHAVEAEFREKAPDGSWGPIRPVAMRIPQELDRTTGKPFRVPSLPKFDETDEFGAQRIREQILRRLESAAWQQFVLQPDYPDVYDPEYGWVSWRVNLPETELSQVPPSEDEGAEGKAEPAEPKKRTPSRRDLDRLRYEYPGPGRGYDRRIRPPRGSEEGTRYRPGMMPSEPGPRRRETVEPGKGPAPKERIVPDWNAQMGLEKVLVWFHHDNLQAGNTYQYRLKLKLVNPLYTYVKGVKEGAEADARRPLLETGWSPWSGEISLRNPTEFYVSGYAKGDVSVEKTMSVDVFTRALGQRVGHRFTIRRGGNIGNQLSVKVVNPVARKEGEAPAKTDRIKTVPADFLTRALAVEFDFARALYKGSSAQPMETAAMFYLDPEGALMVRTYDEDMASARYKELQEETKRTENAVKRLELEAAARERK